MPAIITDDFRRNQAKLLVNDIKASADSNFDSPAGNSNESTWPFRGNNRYSIGLGKSDPWEDNSGGASEGDSGFVVPTPQGTIKEDHDVISNLSTLKDVPQNGVKQLIAKNPWTSGRKYKVYDEADDDMFYTTGEFYPCAVTYNNKVYLCLSNTATSADFTSVAASTTAPSAANNYGISSSGDAQGYVWAHVADIDSNDPLTTNQFVPINGSPTVSDSEKQRTGGLISHIGIVDGGSGYTSAPSVSLIAVKYDGTQAVTAFNVIARAIVEGGVVTRIDLENAGENPDTLGSESYWSTDASDYLTSTVNERIKYVTVSFSGGGGSGAKAYTTVAPVDGFAANAINILPTWFVGINVNFENSESDNDSAIVDFRQVSLLKNFDREADSGDTTLGVLDALKYVVLTSPNTSNINNLSQGDVLTCGSSKFYFDYYDSSSNKLYYHQNSNADVNFINPPASTAVTEASNAIGTTDSTGYNRPEYNAYDSPPSGSITNGEVIFHENRTPFSRGSSQTEEVKIIIQL